MKQTHSFPNCPVHFCVLSQTGQGGKAWVYIGHKNQPRMRRRRYVVSSSSPEASGKGLPCVAMHQLNGKPFEGVAFRYHIVDGLLELLVTHAHSHTAVQLVGRESRREQIAKLIIPHCTQTNVL